MSAKPIAPGIVAEVYKQSDNFWEQYLKGRPKVPQSFFDTIFNYHAQHGGDFHKAHEVGAGAGVHSSRLGARFERVLVSDIHEGNVQRARTLLRENQYSFLTSSLEYTISLVEPESIDLVFASTMMHFTDQSAIEAVYRQLKLGGTFAAGLYGTFALHEPQAQAIWTKIHLLVCEHLMDNFGGNEGASSRVAANEASGLDHVYLPEDQFHSVVRHDINFPSRNVLREMILPGHEHIDIPSRIGENDIVKRDEWDRGWFVNYDLEGLKGIVSTYPHNAHDPEMIRLWEELAAVLNGGTVEGAWLVSLLMATKK